MADPRIFTVSDDDDGIRLDRWFKRHQPDTSFNLVSRWARTGQVRLDGKRVAPGDRITAGQSIAFPPAESQPRPSRPARPRRDPLTAEEVAFVRSLVIYEDEHAFVLNKPPGLATQGGTKTTHHLDRLLDGLADSEGTRPKLVHRLDKDTSGALLVARTARAAALFSKAFSSRTAKKIYWGLIIGVPSAGEGLVDAPLAKQPGTGGEKMYVDPVEGQPSKSLWRTIDRAGNRAAWIELQPLTGRTHQLRVHMLSIGFPIVGDGKYGGPDAFLTGGISRKLHLHARRLKIDSPSGKPIDVTADLPEHFAQSLDTLGFELSTAKLLPAARSTPVGMARAKPQRRDSRRPDGGSRRGKGRK